MLTYFQFFSFNKLIKFEENTIKLTWYYSIADLNWLESILLLTLPALYISGSYIKIKINLRNFFTLLFGALKRWDTTKKVEIKIYVNFFSRLGCRREGLTSFLIL